MTHFQFIDQLAALVGIKGKDVIWAVPGGWVSEKRPTRFELWWDGIHEGRAMHITKVISEADAPQLFAAYFSELKS